ncbi:lymphocyte expansion molecule isoform X2 [Hyla sarda]|uniref:lymphocyte expansion molecule isoform X2 n=1 Tax=Hyla sarda TaxID=327740 RepID=UPI0024C3918C|nr:lymphocyte expansion molecule isoform X2 [Hyla sarda]
MAGKKFTGAPFGCQTARFDVSAVYPELKKPGTYTQVSYCKKATSELERRLGPGTYEAGPGDFSPSVLERNASAPGWKRAEETERLTEMPHLLYKETWERNRFLKQNMGPGRYNTKSFVEMMEEKPSSVRGACNTRDARFKEDSKNSNPGPGTYGKGGNPYALIEERASKSASSKGIMDSETSKCRSATSVGSDLGPGTYNMKGSTDETLKHVVGKRGPYDLFTGSRSGPIPYGYFATPKHNHSEPGQYKIKSFSEELENEQKKKHGKFGKMPQYPKVSGERVICSSLAHWPKPINSPGPGSYETKPLFASVRNSSAPFLTSAKRFDRKSCRILFGSSNPVGVGRYNIEKPARGKTATCFRTSFLSKTGRYLSNFERDKVLQERIQKSHSASSAGKLLAPAYDSTT